MNVENITLIAGGTLTGLLSGLFYAFSVAIVPALRNMKAKEHIAIMQAINVKIINPMFMLSFLGPTFLLPLAAILHRGGTQFALMVAASILHIIGVNGVTIVGNVPLNDQFAKYDINQLSDEEAESIRQAYHGEGAAWMRLHNFRTLASIAAMILVFVAALSKSE